MKYCNIRGPLTMPPGYETMACRRYVSSRDKSRERGLTANQFMATVSIKMAISLIVIHIGWSIDFLIYRHDTLSSIRIPQNGKHSANNGRLIFIKHSPLGARDNVLEIKHSNAEYDMPNYWILFIMYALFKASKSSRSTGYAIIDAQSCTGTLKCIMTSLPDIIRSGFSMLLFGLN